MPAMLTTDCASIGLRGMTADFTGPAAKFCLFFPPVFPVGVKVTEGTVLTLVEAADDPKAEVIVVEPFPKLKEGLFSFPEGGWQDAQ